MKDLNIHFDFYLGKPIEDLLAIEGVEVQGYGLSEFELQKFNSSQLVFNETYLGISLISLQSRQDRDRIIQAIFLYSKTIIDKTFYDKFLKLYGNENRILKIDKLISETNSKVGTEDEFGQQLTKRNYSMKDVFFEDKPDLIIWNNEDFKIEIRFDYNHDFTIISFRN